VFGPANRCLRKAATRWSIVELLVAHPLIQRKAAHGS